MKRHRHIRILSVFLAAMAALILSAAAAEAKAKQTVNFSIAKVYFEYNSTPNDLGVHVFLDGEDWKEIKIVNPQGRTIFEVEGKGPYKDLGLTELFFEGAEPNLADVPLEALLAKFPAGNYQLVGKTVDGERILGTAILTHAIPAGPTNVSAQLSGNSLIISWDPVTGPPVGFPNVPINIVGYQVIVGLFQVTVPATKTSVTVPPEFVESLASGEQLFEVLAIEAGGNQTITESSFTKP
ncbi:MAG: fibronectin type III domain-containing protein [Candidatus Binatia bacterium]|nr:fibronectin type III domain-containing protein [Candidatus Binatia bacterium]